MSPVSLHRVAVAVDADPDDGDNNPSANPGLRHLVGARLRRRHVLKGAVGAVAVAFASSGPAACFDDDGDAPPRRRRWSCAATCSRARSTRPPARPPACPPARLPACPPAGLPA